MIVAQREHLIDEEHERKIASRLFEVGLDLELFAILTGGQLNEISSNIRALNARHRVQ